MDMAFLVEVTKSGVNQVGRRWEKREREKGVNSDQGTHRSIAWFDQRYH